MDDIQISDLLSAFRRRLMATPMAFHRYLYHTINWKDSLISDTSGGRRFVKKTGDV